MNATTTGPATPDTAGALSVLVACVVGHWLVVAGFFLATTSAAFSAYVKSAFADFRDLPLKRGRIATAGCNNAAACSRSRCRRGAVVDNRDHARGDSVCVCARDCRKNDAP
jgi:hypothetical protein